jgi:hypothetical protein
VTLYREDPPKAVDWKGNPRRSSDSGAGTYFVYMGYYWKGVQLPLTASRFPLSAYRLPLTAYRLPLTAYRLPILSLLHHKWLIDSEIAKGETKWLPR